MNVKLDIFFKKKHLFLKTILEKVQERPVLELYCSWKVQACTVLEKFKNVPFLNSSRTYFFFSHTARFHGNTHIWDQNPEKHQK